MNQSSVSAKKWIWILPPIIVGIAIFAFMKSGKQAPQLAATGETARNVRTLIVHKKDFTPIIQGYGEVQPAQIWKAIAQVSGRIISKHKRLHNGELIEKGEVLFQIDPVDYELNLSQAVTQLAELEVQLENAQTSLSIEQRNLDLAEKEYRRLKGLVKSGSVSQSNVDASERTMLNSRAQVQNFKNTISLVPSQKKLQQAKITQAERDLSNSQVRAPFNMRVSALDIEDDQYVSKGQLLFTGDAIDRVEITAQFAPSVLKNLFYGQGDLPLSINEITQNLSSITGFKPIIQLDLGNETPAQWDASFVRFTDGVDTQTRTMGIVVAVDHPLQQIIPGIRPPLSKGMFVSVSIAGKVQPDSIVIPRSAIRNNRVYVMNKENRLEIRPVKIRFHQNENSVINLGLKQDNHLVLSDLIPAIDGMLLNAVNTQNTGE